MSRATTPFRLASGEIGNASGLTNPRHTRGRQSWYSLNLAANAVLIVADEGGVDDRLKPDETVVDKTGSSRR
jgi:hypothetical protein